MSSKILSKPVCCKAREYSIKLLQENVNAADLVQIEVLIKLKCPEARLLEELYNKTCIGMERDRLTLEFPTTQEK